MWPDLDASSRARAAAKHRYAVRCLLLIAADPGRVPAEWHRDGRLEPHQVLLVSYPRAHAYAITATRDPKTRRRLVAGGGQIVDEVTADNRYAADLAKYTALRAVDGHRCVAPRSLVPIGHTDCWRETGGQLRAGLALRQAVRHPEAIDTAAAAAITGWPTDQLEGDLQNLVRQGRLQSLPGPAGMVWSRSQLEDLALAELDTGASRERAARPDGYWMTMTETARALGVSRQHVYRLRSAGRLPARQTAYGLWVARRADLKFRLQRRRRVIPEHAGHHVWRALEGDETNLAIMISNSIRSSESIEGGVRSVRASPARIMFSDYGGAHRGARFEVVSFLVTTPPGLTGFLTERQRLREGQLGTDRRISYKTLNDRVRLASLPAYLDAVDQLMGLLISFAIAVFAIHEGREAWEGELVEDHEEHEDHDHAYVEEKAR